MAKRFRGEVDNKVDAKGRVSVPASFRRVLEEGDAAWSEGQNPNVILVYGGKTRKFIEGYTLNKMDEVEDLIETLPIGTKKRRILEQSISARSVQVQVDETGRLVLSAKLREKFGITNKAMFVGVGATFQIWEPEAYEAHLEKVESWIEDGGDEYDAEDFDPLTLLSQIPAQPSPPSQTPE